MYRPSPPAPAFAFEAGLRAVARQLAASVPDLSEREREWLSDMARDEVRYHMVTVQRLCAAARRSTDLTAREAFAELIRATSMPAKQTLPVPVAFDLETPAPGVADVAQRAYERDPNPSTLTRCRQALARQLAVTRIALDALNSLLGTSPTRSV